MVELGGRFPASVFPVPSARTLVASHWSGPLSPFTLHALLWHVQNELTQVGDKTFCHMPQLGLRTALPTSALGGITDAFSACRHVKAQCALLKIPQQRPGTASTHYPTCLTRSVFFNQIHNHKGPPWQECSQPTLSFYFIKKDSSVTHKKLSTPP